MSAPTTERTTVLEQLDSVASAQEPASLVEEPTAPRRGRITSVLRSLKPSLVLAWAVIGLVIAWALLPGLFTSADPLQGIAAQKLRAPSAEHIFGTDAIGRDLYSRVVHGSINSLSGALLAVTVGLVLGTLIGVAAGSLGPRIDAVLMRIVDVLLAVPALLLALSIIILLGPGTLNTAIAVGIGSIAAFARLTRSEVLKVGRLDFVEAAYASGGRRISVLTRHVLPNSLGPVLSLAAMQFGTAILAISTLGFLGYGSPPPTPEWGLLIAEGRKYIATSWWLTTIPGLIVVAVVLSANRISQSLGNTRNGGTR